MKRFPVEGKQIAYILGIYASAVTCYVWYAVWTIATPKYFFLGDMILEPTAVFHGNVDE